MTKEPKIDLAPKNEISRWTKLRKQLPKMSVRRWSGVALLVLFAGWVVWFSSMRQQDTSKAGDSEKLQVMASFFPVYDLARQIGGDLADVRSLAPAGAEAHDFEPSPRALTDAYSADLFIYHNQRMEPWVSKFIKDYRHVAVETTEGIALHENNHLEEHDDHNEHEDGGGD